MTVSSFSLPKRSTALNAQVSLNNNINKFAVFLFCRQFLGAHGCHVVDVLQRVPLRLAQRQLPQGAEARPAVFLRRPAHWRRLDSPAARDARADARRHGHHARHERHVRLRPSQALHQRPANHHGQQPAAAQREKSHSRCSGNLLLSNLKEGCIINTT